jgi:hypothetical protein
LNRRSNVEFKVDFQATFCEAGFRNLTRADMTQKNSGGGGKGFRKNFECQFHTRSAAGRPNWRPSLVDQSFVGR